MKIKLLQLNNFIISFAVSLMFCSCESSTPEIRDFEWLILSHNDTNLKTTYDRLSIFTQTIDADGLDDIEEIFLVYDADELFWTISSSEWLSYQIENKTWIGTNGLTLPAGKNFPSGKYRIIVTDLAGEHAEKSFFIPSTSSSVIPTISLTDNLMEVIGPHTYSLWIIENDIIIKSLPIERVINLENIVSDLPQVQYAFYVFGYESTNKANLTGPFFWNET